MALLNKQGLETHMKECTERYKDTRDKIDAVGKSLDKIATETQNWRERQGEKWTALQWKIVAGLAGILLILITRIIELLPIHIGAGGH